MSVREYMAFKAGRAFRRGTTNFVDPSPTKGAIWLTQEDDGLVHFKWKNRDTDTFEEDLLLFPGDASFSKVPGANGRVYVLKFSSSDERHFFWLQAASSLRDENFTANVNRVLQDPNTVPVWVPVAELERLPAESSPSGPAAPSASGSAPDAPSAAGRQPTDAELAQLRSLVASMTGGPATPSSAPELSLTDVLTPQTLGPVLTSNPELAASLFPFLPSDLPVPPSTEALRRVLSSPQFRHAVASLDRALRTGMLQDLVRGLGLPSEAGSGIEPFLRAIAEQAKSQGDSGTQGSSMDTD